MAKVTVVETPQPKPPVRVQLDLSLEEAICVAQVSGMIAGDGQVRYALTAVFNALNNDKRIGDLRYALSDMIISARRSTYQTLDIGDFNIPKAV